MSLIAAFLWNKSPKTSISTMIVDEENIQFLLSPHNHPLPKGFFRFRRAVKAAIKEFFTEITRLHKKTKKPIIIEFKIVFHAYDIPFIMPAKESAFVYKTFHYYLKKTKKLIKSIRVKPQLRQRLKGRDLKLFKKELQTLHLVRRKRYTGFEYHLWTVALHATSATYKTKLQQIRRKLLDAMWDEAI